MEPTSGLPYFYPGKTLIRNNTKTNEVFLNLIENDCLTY